MQASRLHSLRYLEHTTRRSLSVFQLREGDLIFI